MAITQRQLDTIEEIQFLTYEQYNSGWCKALEIAEMPGVSSKKYKAIIQNYLDDSTLENSLAFINLFLDDVLIYYTPESFMYMDLVRANWRLSSEKEHPIILEKIIDKSLFFLDKQREDTANEIKEYLSYWDLKDRDEYEKAPQELKDKLKLSNFFRDYGMTETGEPRLEFTDYPRLKKLFSEDLFDKNTVQFFVNTSPKEIDTAFENGTYPAIIGMDKDVISVLWFMD